MSDYVAEIGEMIRRKYCCSQIMVSLALDLSNDGAERGPLMAAMGGLCRGLGGSGNNCGALTGGACALGLLLAREKLDGAVRELVAWFEDEYGSLDCGALTGGDAQKRRDICPGIIRNTYENMLRILDEGAAG